MNFGPGLRRFSRAQPHHGGTGEGVESQVVAGPDWLTGWSSKGSFTCSGPAFSGRRRPDNLEVGARCTCASNSGNELESGFGYGAQGLPNTTNWKALPGGGRPPTHPWERPRWAAKQQDQTQQTGGKKGVKRHVLTDGRGVPLSLVVSGANVHDQRELKALLTGIVVRRPRPRRYRPQTLCLDKGYDSDACRRILCHLGYRDGTKCRGEEQKEKRRDPRKRARRWVVERTHSWMTNWRKILVRYERKVANYLALLCIAAAVTAFRMANVIG